MSFVYTAVAGTAISAVGALQAGKSQSDALGYNAEVQENNARAALASAKLNADKNDIMAQKVMGQARAEYGASGVTATSGSVLDVMSASAMNAELDRQNILYGGQVRAINYQNQASLDRAGANSALNGSYFNAFGKLAQGAALLYGGGAGVGVSGENAVSGQAAQNNGLADDFFGGTGTPGWEHLDVAGTGGKAVFNPSESWPSSPWKL